MTRTRHPTLIQRVWMTIRSFLRTVWLLLEPRLVRIVLFYGDCCARSPVGGTLLFLSTFLLILSLPLAVLAMTQHYFLADRLLSLGLPIILTFLILTLDCAVVIVIAAVITVLLFLVIGLPLIIAGFVIARWIYNLYHTLWPS